MNFILGSGITGYLAKRILEWPFIPFKQSRYFHFEIPWSDNFIKYDEKIDEFMSKLTPKNSAKIIYKQPFSYKGQLLYEQDVAKEIYLEKVYGDNVPKVAQALMKTTFTVYPITAKMLHDSLFNRYKDAINENVAQYGELDKIDINNHQMMFKNGKTVEYDKLVSTIPLDALCNYCGVDMKLKARTVVYYNITTEAIDLEGASQSLVSDLDFKFFKVQMIGKNNYVFWTFDILDNPYQYFGPFIGYRMDVIEAKRILDVIPIGNPPDMSMFESNGIYCVGSNAQWDDFIDVAASICRILRLAGNEFI